MICCKEICIQPDIKKDEVTALKHIGWEGYLETDRQINGQKTKRQTNRQQVRTDDRKDDNIHIKMKS